MIAESSPEAPGSVQKLYSAGLWIWLLELDTKSYVKNTLLSTFMNLSQGIEVISWIHSTRNLGDYASHCNIFLFFKVFFPRRKKTDVIMW